MDYKFFQRTKLNKHFLSSRQTPKFFGSPPLYLQVGCKREGLGIQVSQAQLFGVQKFSLRSGVTDNSFECHVEFC